MKNEKWKIENIYALTPDPNLYCAASTSAADDCAMNNVLRSVTLVPFPSGLLPLGLALLSSILRPVPALVASREGRRPVSGPGR